jgi:hypothetical protein
MPLPPVLETTFNALCHAFAGAVTYADRFEQAAETLEWPTSWVEECLDPAAQEFGGTSQHEDSVAALTLFLDLFHDQLAWKSHRHRPLMDVYDAYQAEITTGSVSPYDLHIPRSIGERLSQQFYARYAGLTALPAVPVDVSVEWADETGMACRHPREREAPANLTFYFAPAGFRFRDFLNLPFYFLHEYMSHLHSAPMFADAVLRQETRKKDYRGAFEDGWLIFAQFDYYWERLCEPGFLGNEPVRYDALKRYIQDTCQVNSPMGRGYGLAEWFYRVVEKVRPGLFHAISARLAQLPYNALGALNLHSEFVEAVGLCRQRGQCHLLQKIVQACYDDVENLWQAMQGKFPCA